MYRFNNPYIEFLKLKIAHGVETISNCLENILENVYDDKMNFNFLN